MKAETNNSAKISEVADVFGLTVKQVLRTLTNISESTIYAEGSEIFIHDDYDKPLIVRWLCRMCHCKWHKANGEGANPR